ncbi:MAG: hypothetical protein K6T90_09200 [Leptolyngbyaceae cyanobacterium HOT.MB2.61]|nr:hypothetical protein [Leptolyngbyaceae cyanobacterium HOT.MB2.61]
MNQDGFKNFQIGLTEISRLLMPFAVLWLLGAIGLGWLVKSFLILIGLILVTPVIAFFGFQWWLKRNLIQSTCPVCQYEFMSLNKAEFRCPSCGEPLKAENGRFNRLTPPGTIDISAVEVPARRIED